MLECLQAILLLSPQIPLLFMGEEYGETRPFSFFTDFHGELADLVREGRRNEFKKFAVFHDADQRKLIPDPNAASTFEASTLDWDELKQPEHHQRLLRTQQLLHLRQTRIVPLLHDIGPDCGAWHATPDTRAFMVSWTLKDGALFAALCQPGRRAVEGAEAMSPESTWDRGALVHAHPNGAADALARGELPGLSVVVRLDNRKLIA